MGYPGFKFSLVSATPQVSKPDTRGHKARAYGPDSTFSKGDRSDRQIAEGFMPACFGFAPFILSNVIRMRFKLAAYLFLPFCLVNALGQTTREPWPRETDQPDTPKPKDVPRPWRDLIGEYGPENEPVYVLEIAGHLSVIFTTGDPKNLDELKPNFERDSRGRARSMTVAGTRYDRRQVGPAEGSGQLRVEPLRPVSELLKAALAAQPPNESGEFRPPELVELVKLDPTIRLEIRYATTNNFLGSVFYSEARAFLQRPASEALVRANRKLKAYGYGLLIHDGYRPWYVTKTFWDATPDEKKWLVADPSAGSRHNRGAAIDLTLYDLKTRRAVEMPSTYDESTPRAYAFYPGGTSLQRWHRALLRRVMESEDFTVNPREWWHFDYKDWRSYGIGNVRFDQLR
jgi:D-alanyl-D-alanine dipeptidase